MILLKASITRPCIIVSKYLAQLNNNVKDNIQNLGTGKMQNSSSLDIKNSSNPKPNKMRKFKSLKDKKHLFIDSASHAQDHLLHWLHSMVVQLLKKHSKQSHQNICQLINSSLLILLKLLRTCPNNSKIGSKLSLLRSTIKNKIIDLLGLNVLLEMILWTKYGNAMYLLLVLAQLDVSF